MNYKRLIRGACKTIMLVPRKLYYKKMQKRLTNKDFTIIANNCFGGLVYHNLNSKFLSPTINLFISDVYFIRFVSNLKEYLAAELTELHEHDKKYPVGQLEYNGETVRIDFMHYHSFEEAKDKWNARKARINYDNIYILYVTDGEVTKEKIDEFESLPYKNKLMITRPNEFESGCMVTHPIFDSPNYKSGKILEQKSLFSLDKYMDDIDYVEFLNKK